jgi:hypothetical protein
MKESRSGAGMDKFRSGINIPGSAALALWNVNMLDRAEPATSHLCYMDKVRCKEDNRHKEYSHLGWRSY